MRESGDKEDVEDAEEEQNRWAWETKCGAKVTAQSLHSRQLKIHKYLFPLLQLPERCHIVTSKR